MRVGEQVNARDHRGVGGQPDVGEGAVEARLGERRNASSRVRRGPVPGRGGAGAAAIQGSPFRRRPVVHRWLLRCPARPVIPAFGAGFGWAGAEVFEDVGAVGGQAGCDDVVLPGDLLASVPELGGGVVGVGL